MKKFTVVLAMSILFMLQSCDVVFAQRNFWVTAYYPEFGDISPTPAQIDWTAFTHIVIFTTEATQTPPYYFRELPGTPDSAYFDGGYTKRIPWRKAIVDSAHRNGVKVLMCLGGEVGANATNFGFMIADPARRAAYIQYVTGFAKRRNFDGFDIDHEFTSSSQGASLVAFFTELRAANPTATITTAVPIWACAAYYNNAAFYNGTTVDQINIMAYRQADGSTVSGFNSPLFQDKSLYPNYNGGCWFGTPSNPYGQGPYDAWVNKGINKSKIGVIIPFEMAEVQGVDAPGIVRPSGAYVRYANYSLIINAKKVNPSGDHWDAISKVPWCTYTDASGLKHYFSYENQASYEAKIDTLWKAGFGGIGIWELFRGYATNASRPDELLQFVKELVAARVGTIIPNPTDITAPVVSITSPLNGATVTDTVLITASASDNVGVTKVDFKVNGAIVGTDLVSPYSYSWNTTGFSGTLSISATAHDAAGNQATSSVVTVKKNLCPDTTGYAQMLIDAYQKGRDSKVCGDTTGLIFKWWSIGKASVDSAGIDYAGYKRGWNQCIVATPDSVSGKLKQIKPTAKP